jgi:FkbM family methyltransferase
VALYGQESEVALLAALLGRRENGVVVDVGAERGSFVAAMLAAGAAAVHAIEPEPENVALLQHRFRDEKRAVVHACAIAATDGEIALHTSVTPDGQPIPFGHTALTRQGTAEITWGATVRVPARSLASLVEQGELPANVDLLKIDTEGFDFEAVLGIGDLTADIIVVEHWIDLPNSLGQCPWHLDDMSGALASRGFSNFAFVVHRGEFTTVQWNDGTVPVGAVGNLIFLHDRAVGDAQHDVLVAATRAALRTVEVAEERAAAAAERLALIDEMKLELDIQTAAAAERLAALEALASGADPR